MFDSGKNFSFCCSVAFQLVGDDHSGNISQSLQQFTEETLGGFSITTGLHQDIECIPILIHCPPEIVMLALEGEPHLIQIPFVPSPGLTSSKCVGIACPKLECPLPNGCICDHDPAISQKFFNIAETQAETKVQPNSAADDLGRITVASLRVGVLFHNRTLPKVCLLHNLTVS